MFPDWMQLVLLLLFAELAVPLVQASVFTYPTKGVQLTPGKPYNIACTSTPAGGTTTTMSTTYPAGISSTSDGAGSALPSSTGATSSSSQCIDGMPADTNGNVGLTERCSELLLVLEEDCTTMAPMAFNFNVSAGMIQLTIPFVGSSDQYRFSRQDSEIRRERK
ncbi:hypothetical protein FKP32DRAFT_1682810 [Trametes sanguinea]|nr:hypothetical protein FKP32DRAFT_1682810 [Trametes sanguinea]